MIRTGGRAVARSPLHYHISIKLTVKSMVMKEAQARRAAVVSHENFL